MERRQRAELKSLEERLGVEKEAWQENFLRRQETALLTKERELREAVRKERDKVCGEGGGGVGVEGVGEEGGGGGLGRGLGVWEGCGDGVGGCAGV